MLGDPSLRILRRGNLEAAIALLGVSDYLAVAYVGSGYDFGEHSDEDLRRSTLEEDPTTLYYTSRIHGENLRGPGQHVVGNVVSMLDLPDHLNPGPSGALSQICEMMRDLRGLLGARYWTGLGRIPAVIGSTNTPVDETFIPGGIGSPTTVRLTLEDVLDQEHIHFRDITLGVIGAGGMLGSRVARSARDRGFQVIGYDIQFRQERQSRNLLFTNNPAELSKCRVVVNVASEGDALLTVMDSLVEGVLVVEDTYPRPSLDTIRQILEVGRLFWVGTQREGIYLEPPFPGRAAEEIAGCLLETIVAVLVGFQIRSPQRFYEVAKQLGFRAIPQEATL